MWQDGEWVAGIAADICDRLAMHAQNAQGVANVLRPGARFADLDEDEQDIINAGVILWKQRKYMRQQYDKKWLEQQKLMGSEKEVAA